MQGCSAEEECTLPVSFDGFVGVARFALDLGDVVGVGIFLDVGVAVVALQAAMNALAELVAIDADAVAGGVLHGLVAMAGEAIGLCRKLARRQSNQKQGNEADQKCYGGPLLV